MNNTKGRVFSVGWCVAHGPDRSHLVNVEWFGKKRDALARFNEVSPAKMWRHTWRSLWDASKVDVKQVAAK